MPPVASPAAAHTQCGGRFVPLLQIKCVQAGGIQSKAGKTAVTRVCTDGRNKMFPSLLFPDRHVAKVRRGTTSFFSP